MLSRLVSTLIIVIILIIVACFLILSNTHAPNNSLKSFETSSYDEIQETTFEEFVLSINISRNSLKKDKNITLYRPLSLNISATTAMTAMAFDIHPNQQHTPAVQGEQHIADKNVVLVDENDKIHSDFHYGINKSNQENNFHNQKVTLPLSNSKIVKSSTTSSSSSSSPETIFTSTRSPSSSAYFERVELHESVTHDKTKKLLLHRKKRYLIFPDGSSFQLVLDLIVPIVDNTNYAIMGITCAVAWELPSKPPSEIIENFRHKLNDGTFGLSRRNDSTQHQLKYINAAHTKSGEGGGNGGNEGVSIRSKQQHYSLQQQQLSATVATTSAHQNFKTNALKPPPPPPPAPPSSNFYYKNRQKEKFPTVPPTPLATATKFVYNQHPQQQQKWHNNNLETADNNQKNNFYGSDNGRSPMHQNDFTQYEHYNNNPPNKWNLNKNWQLQQPQSKQTKQSNDEDDGDYWNKENWWERNKDRIQNQWHENQQKWSQYQEKQSFSNSQLNYNNKPPMLSKRTGRNRKILNKPPKHRIYPVFGKRRRRRSSGYRYPQENTGDDDDEFTKKLHEIHIKEHLHSRQKLYRKIEKLYKTRGHNGTACVLRVLCETEKLHLNARYNETPQTFVMELLRSIFALPKDTLNNTKDSLLHIDAHFSDAVSHANDDTSESCSQRYEGCEHGISYDMQF